MATSHDSLLYQPEGDTGWSCGPFTVVKFLGSQLHLERNGETKFFGCRAQFRLENCNWKQLDGMVASIIRSCGPSIESTSCQEDG